MERLSPLDKKRRCLFDPLYLSKELGYDFHETDHGKELLDTVCPPIIESDKTGEPVPLFDLDQKKNRLTLWSRGHYKTSAVVVRIVQLILAYPDIRILIGQSTARNARGLLREIKSHFDGSNPRSRLAKNGFGSFCKTTRLGTADGFVTPARKRAHLKEHTVAVAGDRTARAGQHYEIAFFDDLVTEQNFRNVEIQQKLIETFHHFTPLIEPGGFINVTGTRYSFADLYGDIIRKDADRREWAISVKTCWKDDKRENGPFFTHRILEDGRAIGFTTELLDKIQKDDPETFSYQYLNQPIMAGRQLFTEELLMRCVRLRPADNDPSLPSFGPAMVFVDLAASQRSQSDHSVVLCGRRDETGRMYVTDLQAGHWSPMQVANALIDMCLRHRPQRALIEGTAAGKYFVEYARIIARDKGLTLPIETMQVSNNKDAKHIRIAAIEGALKTGKLIFFTGLPGWSDVVEQFTQFPKGRHDDEIDTISLMVQFYSQQQFQFVPATEAALPFFLRQPSVDYGLEKQIVTGPTYVRETCGDFF